MFKKRLKIVAGLVGILVVIMGSELLFVWRNKPYLFKKAKVDYHIFLIEKGVKQEEWSELAPHLAGYSSIRIKEVAEYRNKNNVVDEAIFPKSLNDGELEKALVSDISTWDWDRLKTQFATNLAGHYYDLGLIAWNRGASELTEIFWDISRRLAPDWSYFYVELANLNINEGDNDAAERLIDECLRWEKPRFHCSDYSTMAEMNSDNEPGFLEEEIKLHKASLY